ncbi:SGNH/GDSL hydrolase family protein [Paenibacillus cremeus]|uniref:SGNH/GDSL hydrolase family protein n=1 Tax=Paenibacillus cremeus TaxID=2163881 RepID=A0A559K7S2_9BACL|nr:SGNH/GDSL hydrolase family protein [Paenibacillus cremeus]TVY08185.1 SGNH/GDSL hydrolase family protein [Paenibacillus cremeus]
MKKRLKWWMRGLSFSLFFMLLLPGNLFGQPAESMEQFYQNSKSGKVIDFVGDSTTEAAPGLYEQLTNVYAAPGGVLEGVRIRNCGSSGNTLHYFVNQIAANGHTLDQVIRDQADLYIVSYGINDIRESSPEQIQSDLKLAVDRLLKETRGGVLLRIPNPFLSVNRWSYIQMDIAKAQLYSDQLWGVYQSFRDYDPRVDLLDIPSLVFGRQVQPEHPFMQDTIHPNEAGYRAIADAIAQKLSGQPVTPRIN